MFIGACEIIFIRFRSKFKVKTSSTPLFTGVLEITQYTE